MIGGSGAFPTMGPPLSASPWDVNGNPMPGYDNWGNPIQQQPIPVMADAPPPNPFALAPTVGPAPPPVPGAQRAVFDAPPGHTPALPVGSVLDVPGALTTPIAASPPPPPPPPAMPAPAPLVLSDPMRRFAGGMLNREQVALPVMGPALPDGALGAPIASPTHQQQMDAYKSYGFGPAHQFFRPVTPAQPAQGLGGMTEEQIRAMLEEMMAARGFGQQANGGPSAWGAGGSGDNSGMGLGGAAPSGPAEPGEGAYGGGSPADGRS